MARRIRAKHAEKILSDRREAMETPFPQTEVQLKRVLSFDDTESPEETAADGENQQFGPEETDNAEGFEEEAFPGGSKAEVPEVHRFREHEPTTTRQVQRTSLMDRFPSERYAVEPETYIINKVCALVPLEGTAFGDRFNLFGRTDQGCFSISRVQRVVERA
jgi:hypothetical protein